ncbi:C5a anaphylatoxin chemotactic receptor 1-like [Leptodactylus fuscus]|uniref:C5a anaphylatoxin chemotactic receptor 1-like n=1 Tax=Leptodactylus fuscus TaxID=238119 RepID=UPI003F4F2413
MALPQGLCYSMADISHFMERIDFYSSAIVYLTFVMSIVICLVGLVGNAIVIFFTGVIMKKHKSKYWFLNLAIADFFSLLILPLHATAVFKGTWPFGPHMCKLFLFSICVNMHASVLILMALNVARVLSVAKPMFHLKFMTQRVSLWICSIIWVFTLLSSSPVFFYTGEMRIGQSTICSFLGSESFNAALANNWTNVSIENATGDMNVSEIYTTFNPFFKECFNGSCCGGQEAIEFWNHLMFTAKKFVIPFFIIGYFIPLGVIVISNITIIVHVRRSKTINTHRLYRMVLAIIVVYFITWTPAVVGDLVMYSAVLNMDLKLFLNVVLLFHFFVNIAYINNCLNPILYVLSGGRIRTGLSDFVSSLRSSYK